jgi:septum formation protein
LKSRIQNPYSRIPLILASASPRRAELLREAGIPFRVVVSPAHEPARKPAAIPVDLWPMCLAYMKARAVQRHLQNGKSKIKNQESIEPLILAADTIVVNDAQILNKARDRAHARQILRSLQGQTHRVITGICLLRGDRLRLASAQSLCRVKNVSAAWLEQYLDSGLWRGKAGAYGIQDSHDPFVRLLRGDFSTVVGLPMALVQSELASFAKA